MPERIGVYPGSFDPPTLGHLDLMKRACRLFDKVIVAVANNTEKHNLFTYEERVEMIQELTTDLDAIEVRPFKGLIIDLVREVDAIALIRGLRAVSDFENEMTMAATNMKMLSTCDTISFMPSEQYMFISSRLVKEIVQLGGDVTPFVPPMVVTRLMDRLGKS
ncbi:MAG: pantetheine-phosphate adenylyltransferase [Candidatus Hydrogenedentota bacterium]|nr:MAG: pantetheine-phosphate adenylyltransferase [Candidatus Hydrogenedentota bacterium]